MKRRFNDTTPLQKAWPQLEPAAVPPPEVVPIQLDPVEVASALAPQLLRATGQAREVDSVQLQRAVTRLLLCVGVLAAVCVVCALTSALAASANRRMSNHLEKLIRALLRS